MTKKDYIVFAEMMKTLRKDRSVYRESYAWVRASDVESALANIFARDNERFDVARFVKACGQ